MESFVAGSVVEDFVEVLSESTDLGEDDDRSSPHWAHFGSAASSAGVCVFNVPQWSQVINSSAFTGKSSRTGADRRHRVRKIGKVYDTGSCRRFKE